MSEAGSAGQKDKIPVTVLTGYLGSGKTTLLKNILNSPVHKKRIAVIENEFAMEIGVKHELSEYDLSHAACVAELFETSNGCLCCSGAADFSRILYTLIEHRDRFDYILIETTGLADPVFASTFFNDPYLRDHLRLDGIVCMVDAENIITQLNATSPPSKEIGIVHINEAQEQVAIADRIFINKCDRISQSFEIIADIEIRLKEINPFAPIRETIFSETEQKDVVSDILGIDAFSIERVLKRDPNFLDFRPYRRHDAQIAALSLRINGRVPDGEEFVNKWVKEIIKEVISEEYGEILRCKGVLTDLSGTRWVWQGVRQHVEIKKSETKEKDEKELNRMVFIGRRLGVKAICESFERWRGERKKEIPEISIEMVQTGLGAGGSEGSSGTPWGSIILLGIIVMMYKWQDQMDMDAYGWPTVIAMLAVALIGWLTFKRFSRKVKK